MKNFLKLFLVSVVAFLVGIFPIYYLTLYIFSFARHLLKIILDSMYPDAFMLFNMSYGFNINIQSNFDKVYYAYLALYTIIIIEFVSSKFIGQKKVENENRN